MTSSLEGGESEGADLGPPAAAGQGVARRRGRGRRALRRSWIVLFEVAVGIMTTAALAVGLGWWRLSQGPIALGPVARHLEAELSNARGGRQVTIDRVALSWNPVTRGLELTAYDVTPRDEYGRVLSVSREVALEIAPESLFLGRLTLSRAEFAGGEVAVVLAKDGSGRVSLGPPGSSPDIVVPPPPPNETLVQRANRILDAVAATFRPLGAGSHLKSFAIDDLKLVIIHEASGRRWTAEGARFQLERVGEALQLDVDGVLSSARGSAPVGASIAADTDFNRAVVELRVRRGRIDALAPEMLGALKGLEAPVTASVSATFDRKLGIERLEGEAEIGRGRLALADGAARLDGGRIRGRYDIETDVFVLQEAGLAGTSTRILGEGRIERASALLAANDQGPAAIALDFSSLTLDAPGVFEAPVTLGDVSLRGAFDGKARELRLESFGFDVAEGVRGRLAGRMWWEADGDRLRPGLELEGAIDGELTPAQVLAVWPVKLAPTSRTWVRDSVKAARSRDLAFRMRAPPAELADWPLPNEDLELGFAFDDAEVHYYPGMAPITGGAGRVTLRGDSLAATLERGEVAGLSVAEGRVDLPRFQPAGALATYSGRVTGEARAMVEVLRKAPIELDEALPFDPATIVGRGEARFAIRRPMLKDAPPESFLFSVNAALRDVGGRAKDTGLEVSDWTLNIAGDERALTFIGPLMVERSPVMLSWTETLRGGGATPSRFTAEGDLDAATIERLGVPITPFVRGPVGVRMSAAGAGVEVKTAVVEADLTGAEVQAIDGYWFKPSGQAASVRFDLATEPDGDQVLSNIAARGAGLRVDGEARFLKTGEIAEARFPRVEVAERMSGRLDAMLTPNGALEVEITGDSVHLGPFLDRAALAMTPFPKPAGPPLPISGAIRADRLVFKGRAALSAGAVDFGTDGREMTWLAMRGQSPAGPAQFRITPRASGPARITASAPDAGLAWEAVTGQPNVRGGALAADGLWTPYAPIQARATVRIRDFEMVEVPAMAQLLSSFGSLRGLVDMLNGEGIAFSQLTAPIALSKERLTFDDTRMHGPSLGFTANGSVDLATGRLNLDGVVVPAYGLNSMLGQVPMVGGLLTSRRGEGVVGITFAMRGPAEAAQVIVNPLSVLAPGFLRRIFEPLPAPAAEEEDKPELPMPPQGG